MSRIELSVILTFHNAAQWLPTQLTALSKEDPGTEWEVIAVDNDSTDDSVAVLERFTDVIPLRLVVADREQNQAYARNLGARLARGRNLVFIDADDEIVPGYLSSMNAALQAHRFVTTHRDDMTLNPPWLHNAHSVPRSTHDGGRFLPFAFGCSVGIRKEIFDEVGGIPENFGPLQDQALSFEVQFLDVHRYVVPDTVIRYRYRSTIYGLFRQTREWGYYQPLLFRAYRKRGMPRRKLRETLSAWGGLLSALLRSRNRSDIAQLAVRVGYCLGRLKGSIRYRVLYL